MKDSVEARLEVSRKLGLYLFASLPFFVTLQVVIMNSQPPMMVAQALRARVHSVHV